MLEKILQYHEYASGAISLFAVAVIVVGFSVAAGRYAFRFRELSPEKVFKQFKVELGKALTLGLEILVLADVIKTITVTPTYQSLAVLAFLVVVRTVVSWTLELEIEGRWPWQAETEEANA
jgi:uncharacterized membrane protein